MKKIGLMGGLGPASTVEYYMGLVNMTLEHKGPECYPRIVIDSVDMGLYTELFEQNEYKAIGDLICDSLLTLKNAGCEVAAVTANTEHIVWDYVKDRLPMKTISIVDAVIEECKRNDYSKVVTFGTKWTLKSGLYENAFKKAGITPIVPDESDIEILGSIIYPNLENGIVIPEDKARMIQLAEKYIQAGDADALLLGCTEIPLMIKQGDVSVPVVDTMKVHVKALYEYASL